MSRWSVLLLLASWEFRRFFKWKSQLVGWGLALSVMAGLAFVAPRLVDRAVAETTTIGLLGQAPFEVPDSLGVRVRSGPDAELEAAFARGDLGGLLAFDSDQQGSLRARSEGGWIETLQASLDNARRQARLAAHDLDPQVLADVMAPFVLQRQILGEDDTAHTGADADHAEAHDHAGVETHPDTRPSKWDRILALTMLGFMFGGVFSGTALLFTGITSEKQQLVTEQIVAAVPPQTWIDGKILGIGFRSITGVIEMVLWSLLGMLIWRDRVDPDFAGLEQISPGLLATVALLASLGFALWFCVFAAIAASIDDPNTSARGVLLMLPMIAPVLAVPAWFQPDGDLAVVLSMLPPTATMDMTVRLALGQVPTWQLLVAVTGMIVSIALLRRGAGKVFAMACLMRGKEPSWREMWAAARRS